jgi:hypothetical protein
MVQIVTLPLVSCSDRKAGDQGISSWGWNLNGQHSTYHALFPRAWTIYDGIIPLYCFCMMCVCIYIYISSNLGFFFWLTYFYSFR